VLEAVLFDWGGTLIDWAWDDDLLVDGHRAGHEATGRAYEPAFTERFRAELLPVLQATGGSLEEVEYPELVRMLLGGSSDDELRRYLEAEHAAWAPARRLAQWSRPLLDALRRRGLKLGLVSNTFDPGWLLRRDLEEQGLSERLDVAVFSSDVGKRKPDPAIYRAALDPLGVAPAAAVFVGDRLVEDVQGPAALGMRTVQALWFRAEEPVAGIEPDFRAFTQLDVLNAVDRLGVSVSAS
jgi:putative hydrolase of the HAD superfamily